MNRFSKFVCILILTCSMPPLAADGEAVDLYATVDTVAIDAIWRDHISLRFSVGSMIVDGVGIELPVAYTVDRSGGDEILLDIALKLMVYPWGSGPFMSLSLSQACMFIGSFVPEDSIHYLNEIGIGYTWEFSPRWFLRPSVIYRDPSNSLEEDFAYVEGLVPTRGKVQFCLEIGWLFASITH